MKKDELLFELDGKVFIIEKKNGKIVEKTELDGNLVLKCLVAVLTDGLNSMDKKGLDEKKKKRSSK